MKNHIQIYTDGGSRGNPGPSAAGFVVLKNNEVLYKGSKFLGLGTNNNAEYNAVLLALEWLYENINNFQISEVQFFLDSELVVNQLTGKYKIKNENIKSLITAINVIRAKLDLGFSFTAVRRDKNKLADQMVNECLDLN